MAEQEEVFLSKHTLAMRRALQACQALLATTPLESCEGWTLDAAAVQDARLSHLQVRRQTSYNAMLAEHKGDASRTTLTSIHYQPDDDSFAAEFRRNFTQANRPCRVHGLTEAYFAYPRAHWSSATRLRAWMRQSVGATAMLPVRQAATAALDDQGRATECETVHRSLEDWIAYLDGALVAPEEEGGRSTEKDYLKDWHLEAWLAQHENSGSTALPVLYQVPAIFQRDLLNPFLQAFTGGDYRFVYWGPAGSRTTWHSDVLHSFSWSYNVYGSKEWTFCLPDNGQVTLLQKAGECIFVPATWKHQVVNLEETLSINRNWVTAANVDLCWECLSTEIQSIEVELASWGNDYDWEARESMLRGCVGLDMTAFYLMILYRLATILHLKTSGHGEAGGEGIVFDYDDSFEIARLVETMDHLFKNDPVHLSDRLAATLATAEFAQNALDMGSLIYRAHSSFQ
jgi:hypothetical protein